MVPIFEHRASWLLRDLRMFAFFESDETPDELDVAVSVLDDCDQLAPEMHIWTPSKLSWSRVDDGLPAHVADSKSSKVEELAPAVLPHAKGLS